MAATLCLSAEEATLEVVPVVIGNQEWRPNWEEDWPPNWLRFLGTKTVPLVKARRFLEELKDLGSWQLAECGRDCRGGFCYHHVIASRGRDHCILIGNPQHQSEPAYQEIVNLYSETFFNGAFTWNWEHQKPGNRSVFELGWFSEDQDFGKRET
jgi:hypothetical protein